MVGREDEVLARLEASLPRRVIGTLAQIGQGGLLIWLAWGLGGNQMGLQLLLFILGLVAFYLGHLTWRATGKELVLTRARLSDSDGRVLVEIANVQDVVRGALTFKPSHGFSLRLREGTGVSWVPGMWWRIGKRIGVGGVIAASPSRLMADRIADLIAARDV